MAETTSEVMCACCRADAVGICTGTCSLYAVSARNDVRCVSGTSHKAAAQILGASQGLTIVQALSIAEVCLVITAELIHVCGMQIDKG